MLNNFFSVLAIDAKTKRLSGLFVTESQELAETRALEAKRAGWLLVRVCSSKQEHDEWKREAREVIADMSDHSPSP